MGPAAPGGCDAGGCDGGWGCEKEQGWGARRRCVSATPGGDSHFSSSASRGDKRGVVSGAVLSARPALVRGKEREVKAVQRKKRGEIREREKGRTTGGQARGETAARRAVQGAGEQADGRGGQEARQRVGTRGDLGGGEERSREEGGLKGERWARKQKFQRTRADRAEEVKKKAMRRDRWGGVAVAGRLARRESEPRVEGAVQVDRAARRPGRLKKGEHVRWPLTSPRDQRPPDLGSCGSSRRQTELKDR